MTATTISVQAICRNSKGTVLTTDSDKVVYFVNGQKKAFPTDLQIGMTYVIVARCSGYQDQSKDFTPQANAGTQPWVEFVLATNDTSLVISLQFYPSVEGISSVLQDAAGKQIGTNLYTGSGGLVTASLPSSGTYNVVCTDSRYTAKTVKIEVNDYLRKFSIQLVSSAAANSNSKGVDQKATLAAADDPQYQTLVTDVSETTYDNSAYQGYFTSAQARIYIGDLFIDEVNTIQYALQQNNIPVHGYASRFADAYGRGRSIVQGQIVLNFVHQGYLYAALKNYQTKIVQQSQDTKALAAAGTISSAIKSGSATQINSLLKSSVPSDIAVVQKLLKGSGAQDSYVNPVYLNTVFDIRIEIGDGSYLTTRLLEKCVLGVNEQILDQSGQPIAESYAFMARRLK